MTVLVVDDQQLANVDVAAWQSRLAALLGQLGLAGSCQLSVAFVDDEAIAALNRDFRGLDKPTDVLSFPQEDFRGVPDATQRLGTSSYGPDGPPIALGDIVVSIEAALRQAAEYGHSLDREIGFLLVHGLLHLLGEDHETPEQEQQMRALQRQCLDFWDLQRQ
ncbi:MAG: rRNA maturation RNase YbeY [Cyanobacteria bacterium REEB65]|nr:rRNA maturation RNase YbeY [Cyanobacteria bacterium REEB65]